MFAGLVGLGRFEDAAFGLVLLPVDALGVDPKQDVHAVARPLGDPRWRYPGVEPGRDGGMPERVGNLSKRRGGLFSCERRAAGLAEHIQVNPFSDATSAQIVESPTARPGREDADVFPQHSDPSVQRYGAGLADGPVLQFARLSGLAALGPVGPAAWGLLIPSKAAWISGSAKLSVASKRC